LKEIIALEEEFMVIQKEKYYERLEEDKKINHSV